MKSKDLENKLEKIIDDSYQEETKAIYDNLKKVLVFLDDAAPAEIPSAATAAEKPVAQKPASKWRNSFRNFFKQPARLAACISAAVAVACLAIILPFTLNGNGSQTATTTPPSTSEDRFCVAAACKEIELKCSLNEYTARNNLSFLYVDWYAVADIKTSMYVNKENSFDIVYYEEILKHKYTGSIVELYITDSKTQVDKVQNYRNLCNRIYHDNPHALVKWGYETVKNGEPYTYMAWFQYDTYTYALVLRYPVDGNDIIDLVNSMLPEFKTLPEYRKI